MKEVLTEEFSVALCCVVQDPDAMVKRWQEALMQRSATVHWDLINFMICSIFKMCAIWLVKSSGSCYTSHG